MPSELLKFIKLSETTDSPWQGRLQNVDKNDIEELADSIKQNGLMQPVIVREKDNKYEIIDGHRRVAAYKVDVSYNCMFITTYTSSVASKW